MPRVMRVTTIPATVNKYSQPLTDTVKKRRVAAYARVSTDNEEQQSSYEAQIDYYTHYIKERPDWEFVNVYTDEGITGTSTKHRKGFQKMVSDALSGKIDLIVTKSVSRFARNTVDSLMTIRKLKENKVECYFEKENIWTFDGKGELLITIMSSLAQEESRSISENTKWGIRKKFADGQVSFNGLLLGYTFGPKGTLVVEPKEAKVVKKIYKLFLIGMTPFAIARKLTKDGIPTPAKKTKWSQGTVKSILTNEKYMGDALLQKGYNADFLSKKRLVNHGEIPQYYVEGSHEPIINKDMFEVVQLEMKNRAKGLGKHSGVNIFSSKIICGDCGGFYGRTTWHSNDRSRKQVYRCCNKYKGDHKCSTPTLVEEDITEKFIKAMRVLIANKEQAIKEIEMKNVRSDKIAKLEAGKAEAYRTINALVIKIKGYEDTSSDEYERLVEKYDAAKESHRKIAEKLSEALANKTVAERVIKYLMRQKGEVKTFNRRQWCRLLEYATIYPDGEMLFTFRGGFEVRI